MDADARKIALGAGAAGLGVALLVWVLGSFFAPSGEPIRRHVEATFRAEDARLQREAASLTEPSEPEENTEPTSPLLKEFNDERNEGLQRQRNLATRLRQNSLRSFNRDTDAFNQLWQDSNRTFDRSWTLFWVLFGLSTGGGVAWFIWTLLRRAHVAKHKPDVLGERAAEMIDKLGAAPATGTATVLGGFVGERALSISTEDRAVVIGPPGTGKTSFLVSQLLKWAEQKRSFICLDAKPEIFGIARARLDELGYHVLSYNPTEATGQKYNILDDIESPEGLGELATALIPGDQEQGAVFYESSRDFLDGIVSHLRATLRAQGRTPSLVDVRNFLNECEGYQALLQTLMNSPDSDVRGIANALSITASNPRLIGSIFALFRANLRFVRYPNIRASLERSDFSLHDLCTEKPVALFLQFEEKNRETTARLLVAMVAHVLRFFIVHHTRPPVLLLLDEIGTAPVIPSLVQKLNTIRSRNLPTWLYFQTLEQMQPYGETKDQGPNLILGACDMQMVFRLNDNSAAQWMSDRVGVVDRTVESMSIRIGEYAQTSRNLVTEPLLWPHQLQALAASEVVCTYRGKTWRGTATPYYRLWPQLQDQRPKAEDLHGPPYPASPLQVVAETG